MSVKRHLSILIVIACIAFAWKTLAQSQSLTNETLTLQQAEAMAITNHPRITAAQLIALASKQVVRETRSAYFPRIAVDATAVGAAQSNTRIEAGGLNNPQILDREANGVSLNQLIFDFGRTINLNASSKLQAKAQEQNALATRAQILLTVCNSYFDTLRSQSVLDVAKQTVATRQQTFDQINELVKNKLKSGLDLSFSRVDLDSAKLLLADANNDLEAARATLANVLGEREEHDYHLSDEPISSNSLPDNAQLIETALENRPDLVQLRFGHDAAQRFARAEKDLNYPTVNAIAVAGFAPTHDPALRGEYAAAGIDINLPIFDGMLFDARKKEADLRAKALEESLRDAENNIVRDVRIARLNLDYASERLALTAELLASASEAFDLAQAKYKFGSSSIVELSQAQLAQTQAKIDETRAKYEFQIRNAVLTYQIGVLH